MIVTCYHEQINALSHNYSFCVSVSVNASVEVCSPGTREHGIAEVETLRALLRSTLRRADSSRTLFAYSASN